MFLHTSYWLGFVINRFVYTIKKPRRKRRRTQTNLLVSNHEISFDFLLANFFEYIVQHKKKLYHSQIMLIIVYRKEKRPRYSKQSSLQGISFTRSWRTQKKGIYNQSLQTIQHKNWKNVNILYCTEVQTDSNTYFFKTNAISFTLHR